jgi:hypothetical protein
MRALLITTLIAGFAAPVSAEVVDSSEHGFTIRNVAEIAAPQMAVSA